MQPGVQSHELAAESIAYRSHPRAKPVEVVRELRTSPARCHTKEELKDPDRRRFGYRPTRRVCSLPCSEKQTPTWATGCAQQRETVVYSESANAWRPLTARLLIDATVVTPRMDGLGVYAHWLTRKIINTFGVTTHVTVAVAASAIGAALWRDARHAEIVAAPTERPSGSVYTDEYFAAWERFVASYAPDVYLSTAFVNTTFPCRRAVVIHDLAPLAVPADIAARKVERFAALISTSVRNAELVLAPSNAMASEIRRYFRGSNVRALYPDIAQLVGRLSGPRCPENYDYVIIGVKCPRKNITLALNALRLVQKTRCFRAALIGNLRENDVPVRGLIRDAGLEDCVDVLGYVPDGRLRDLLANAHALLFPSRYEGFGIPAVEAMAMHTPVVCLPLPVLQELLGPYAVYVENNPASFAAGILRASRSRTTVVANARLNALGRMHDRQFLQVCRWLGATAEP